MYFLIRENNIIGYQELEVLDADVQMIQATKAQEKNVNKYSYEYYIYKNGQIKENPDYINIVKTDKYAENDQKANEARYGREFTITIQEQECVFDTTQTTQTDLLTAFAVCSTGATYDGWVTNNGVELDLTFEDVALISQTFKAESDVYHQWNEYKTAIDNAETIEDVEEIEINYD